MTFTDPGAYVKPWGFTVTMTLAADTEMLEAICERSSNDWAGSLSETESRAVSVPTEVLAGYVGSYTGIYGGSERTYEVSLSDGQLFANIVGTRAEVEGGLAAGGLDAGFAAAAGAAIPDAVRRPGTRLPVHRRRQWCGDRPRGDPHIGSLYLPTSAVTPIVDFTNRRNRRTCMKLFLAALALMMGTIPATAQWLDRPWPGIPRTADGKPNLTAPAPRGPDGKPDLTGSWSGPVPEPALTPPTRSPGSTISSVGVSRSTTRLAPPISACRAGRA